MTLTWLGRVALYIAFAGTLGGIVHQARRPSNGEGVALLSLGARVVAWGRRRRRGDAVRVDHAQLLARVRVREQRDVHTAALFDHRYVVGPRGFAPPLGAPARVAHRGGGPLLPAPERGPRRGMGNGRPLRGQRVLHRADVRPGRSVHPQRGQNPPGRRSERALAGQPAGRYSPTAALRGVRRFHRAVRLRDRDAHHRTRARSLAARAASLDGAGLGGALGGHRARRVVELPGARMGWLLGMGPRRERGAAALVDRHRLHPLGDRAGSAGTLSRVEPLARDRDLFADRARNVLHPFGGPAERARLFLEHVGATAHRVLRRHGRARYWPARVARRPPALTGRR